MFSLNYADPSKKIHVKHPCAARLADLGVGRFATSPKSHACSQPCYMVGTSPAASINDGTPNILSYLYLKYGKQLALEVEKHHFWWNIRRFELMRHWPRNKHCHGCCSTVAPAIFVWERTNKCLVLKWAPIMSRILGRKTPQREHTEQTSSEPSSLAIINLYNCIVWSLT